MKRKIANGLLMLVAGALGVGDGTVHGRFNHRI
jgi:hypothetical protein